MQSLIDRPKELLELINECLKPKDIEKKKFGEVFTPIKIVNEMLDILPKDVWFDKNLKWFDPATGMGNFPIAIYQRLMESLKKSD
jgi:type I restriction-modification system DNA methylase subunit